MSTATSANGRPSAVGTDATASLEATASVDTTTSLDATAASGITVPAETAAAGTREFQSDATADRLMRRLLRVDGLDRSAGAGAHRAFRISVVVSAVRCLITYLAIPILIPLLSLAGWVAAPIGLALCVIAVVNGVISVRRFWVADHPRRWMYTGFMAVVFAILAVAMVAEVRQMGM